MISTLKITLTKPGMVFQRYNTQVNVMDIWISMFGVVSFLFISKWFVVRISITLYEKKKKVFDFNLMKPMGINVGNLHFKP